MAEVKSNFEMEIMKETLCAQQKLLQKLYNELEAEREASSSAASEAMSVILRLQGERAAVQMEAEQFKRLVEEKLSYAEESLSIFEDIMYQKEMEVSGLEYQLEAYRCKLLSMGITDPDIDEMDIPESLPQIRNETAVGEMNLNALGRRNSAPVIPLKSYMKKGNENESLSSHQVDVVTKIVESRLGKDINESSSDWDRKTESAIIGDIHSYVEQIRKLDGRIKEIAGVSYGNFRGSSRSASTAPSPGNLRGFSRSPSPGILRSPSRSPSPLLPTSVNPYDPTKRALELSPSLLHSKLKEIDHVKHTGNSLETETETETETVNDSAGSPGVLDVFEVPQVDHRYDDSQLKGRNQKKLVALDEEEDLEKRDLFEETVKSSSRDENDWLNHVLKSSNQGKDICIPSDAVEVDCSLAIVHPRSRVPVSQPELQQVSQTSEIVERLNMRQEGINREEELTLLKEIREQISSIQCQIESWKVKRAPPSPRDDDIYINILSEAMIYFWM